MKVMIIGNGGREHALGWNISKSDEVSEVIYAPGNAGTAEGKGRNVDIDPMDFPGLISFIESENLDLTVVGPEAPLAKGLVDLLHARGYQHVFGCTRKAAMLESDKFFSYDLMRSLDIPQAESIKCYTLEEAFAAIRKLATNQGVVIQARGLTGGKGVTVCESKTEALEEIVRHTEKYGTEVLIAERLSGQEFSVFGISDGNQVLPLEISLQDHKPVFDGDKGPNTGGMGAYGPASVASRIVVKEVSDGIMNPLVRKMRYARNPFVGFLYAGMIMTSEGPKVIEFNVRFGDPECQPAMMMVDSLYMPIQMTLEGKLDEAKISYEKGAACCVILASDGYPRNYAKGLQIKGIEDANEMGGVKVFHAGTTMKGADVVTSGGRVLGVTAKADNIEGAQKLAYDAVVKISFPGVHYRRDIAFNAVGR